MARLAGLALLAAAASLVSGSGDESVLAAEINRLNNQSLFWGPYKPNLYFGVRPRVPQALWTGLMWGRMENFEDIKDGFRYTCEQGKDIPGYGWDEFDARTGGVQTIHDEGNNIDISTSFVKIAGGGHGGSWAARIKGTPRASAPDKLKSTVVYYLAQEGDGDLEPEQQEGSEGGFKSDVLFRGRSNALGSYKMVITNGKGEHPTSDDELSSTRPGDTTVVNSQQLPDDMIWQAKAVVFQQLQRAAAEVQESTADESQAGPSPWQVYRVPHRPAKGNVHVVQKTFEGPFEFDVLFSSGSSGVEVTSESATREMARASAAFSDRFQRVFPLQEPFTGEEYVKFGKNMLSNLVGGIGYFYGDQLVDRSYAAEYDEEGESFWVEAAEARAQGKQKLEGPYELFTAIPSRSFFPRGFLWDEGFHLLLISDWDLDLGLEVLSSWFATMDEDGWIAREQILGAEARSKVPEEFRVQYPHYGNPPTLFLVVDGMLERLQARRNGTSGSSRSSRRLDTDDDGERLYTAHLDNEELGWDYLRRLYPLLRRQYDWFRKTQRGEVKSYDRTAYAPKEAYRWRGRTERHCLTSGLDDYPRPQPPHPGELHVDLLSWMGLMTGTLLRLSEGLGLADEADELRTRLSGLERNAVDLHWSESEGIFCDASVDEFDEHRLVCHRGYVSLMPLLTGLVDAGDERTGRILEGLGEGGGLWSRFGGIATGTGPFRTRARTLHNELRRNLVRTVYESWRETGFVWEQYGDVRIRRGNSELGH
ncbi:hypothetical protein CDD80_684 [Ophiocordyceps camponoti-rufipedis]|uniref:Mannosyl-oligosaccharide glucosidase n=1 Tax=Ophiocordyceps camponoti-rufipedis TaxID=2004952 RepID=A0A2C5YK06_9HYPO|nr:hypothetical protein CDD80_684 [Ophiocordyceps camponoti-rufipedis]